MKKFLILLSMLFCFTAFAQTETLNWYIGDDVYATTTCESGNDILLPTTPTKRGYTFKGWESYIPIEYLESTGTQYIDTNYVITSNQYSGFDIKVSITQSFGGKQIIGSQTGGDSNWFFNPYFNSPNDCTINIGSSRAPHFDVQQNVIYTISFRTSFDNTWSGMINYISYGGAYSGTVVSNQHLCFFTGGNPNGGMLGRIIYGRIYYAKIYDNDTLVRDFIPVLDGNGTPCMYDKVEKKFYYNAGTGQFIAGPIIGAE